MQPIEFTCSKSIPATADAIFLRIADTGRWSEFRGYWLLPGIRSARYGRRTEDMVGSRIQVVNTDGSEHVEEILRWDAGTGITMRLQGFTPPLSRLVACIDELWEFESRGGATLVTRTMRMHPTNTLTRPLAWMISLLLRRAIAVHLRQMADQAGGGR